MGVIETVLGSVSPVALGPTLPHEHLSSNSSAQAKALYLAPDEVLDAAGIDHRERYRLVEPIRMDNLGWIRRHVRNIENLSLDDVDAVIESVTEYREAGGTAVVDCTSNGLQRNPEALRRIALTTGIHVIMGCGYYLADFHPPEVAALDVSAIANRMIVDLQIGVGEPRIRAGVIGEIGTSWPIHPQEDKVLRAAAIAALATGAGMQVHPGRHPDAPEAVLSILADAGADLQRVSMSHVDRTLTSASAILRLAGSGCFVEFDMFGQESTYYPYGDFDLPNDGARIALMRQLIDGGILKQILMSQDLGYKAQLPRYGGGGYAHLLRNVIPLMRRRGFAEAEIAQIVVHNPARLLSRPTRSLHVE